MTPVEPLSKSHLRLWLRLLRASRGIETGLRERLRQEFGSTLPRFDVLAALRRHEGGLRMSELSSVLKVSNGNVTGIIERLVEDALVERIAVSGDRRATRVQLTAAGKTHFQQLAAAHEKWVSARLETFNAEETDVLLALLNRIEQPTGETSN